MGYGDDYILRFDAIACDFGDHATRDDNLPEDVFLYGSVNQTYEVGDDATFGCEGETCQ